MSESRVAKATIRDDARLEALAEAEEEHGSLADAIRFAVSEAYVDGDDVGETEDSVISLKAREGHRKLVEWTGIGGRIETGDGGVGTREPPEHQDRCDSADGSEAAEGEGRDPASSGSTTCGSSSVRSTMQRSASTLSQTRRRTRSRRTAGRRERLDEPAAAETEATHGE